MKAAKYCLIIALLSYWVVGLFGCAAIKEGGRCLIGVSTKDIEASRKDALSRSFNYGFNACYDKTQKILKDIGAYIYAKNKGMIAVFVSSKDTTPVGLFFKELDASNTEIQVSSPSSYAKELIGDKVFSALEGNTDEK